MIILNTRSAQALELAGMPRSAWNGVNKTGDAFYEGLLTGQLSRNPGGPFTSVRPSGGGIMKKQKLLVLPFASSSIINGPSLATDGGDLLLSMDFDNDEQTSPVCLRFVKQRAFRKRSESYCTEWHVVDVYDTVCEVQESDWVSELRAASAPEWRDKWIMRHFMIYVDSFGCVEVIAESASFDEIGVKNSGGT